MSESVPKRVTLQDVSRLAGVDKSTVSRALSGDVTLKIRDETRVRIEHAVSQLGYRPNPAARSLRRARSFVLGAITPALDVPIYAQMLRGAEKAAQARGYTLLIALAEVGMEDAKIYDRLIRQHHVDGLLVLTLSNEQVYVPALQASAAPYVVVNRRAEGIENWVIADDYGAACLATDYLIAQGHRRIAYLTGNPHRFNSRERLAGYRDTLIKAGIAYDETLISEAGYSFEEGVSAMERLLDRQAQGVTATLALTLLAGCGAMSVLHRRGVSIPGDMSVMAIHDGAPAEMVYPPMTTVRIPLVEMGHCGAQALIDLIEEQRANITETFDDLRIVERASVRSLNGNV